ncbi:MAG: adenosine kinase [Spirochaetales bacterium]|nr:adenosine kinase [Spirochaetales bacterium]
MAEVYGIGNPLIDILTTVSDSDLEKLSLHKGTMHLIDKQRHRILIDYLKNKDLVYLPGGSAPNTMVTLCSLGVQTTIAGGLGKDELAEEYRKKLKETGVRDELVGKDEPTGTSVILLSEDRERTMNTFLGANHLYDENDVNLESVSKASLFYFTGYMWDTKEQKSAIRKVLKFCTENNIKVAFDVADPFAVGRYRDEFLELIEKHCDIVFANNSEARQLFDKYEAYECCKKLGKICNIAVVKNGKRGSFTCENGVITEIPMQGKSTPIDTTGAGDTYAAGFLFGYVNGLTIEKCGMIASYLAGEIVNQMGAQFSKEKSKEVRDHIMKTYF